MTLFIMDIPDDPARLPDWLEQHLVGLDLGALVAELSVVRGTSTGPGAAQRVSPGQLLGRYRDAVLARGLSAAPLSLVQDLLRHPEALLELQQLVLAEGGVYWDRLPRPAEADELVESGHRRLQPLLGSPVRAAFLPSVAPAEAPSRTPFFRRPWFVSLATATAILIAVSLWQQFTPYRPQLFTPHRPRSVVTAWARADLPPDEGPAAYLDSLADAAEEWFDERPEQPAALAERIGEMRQGCSQLIFAEHEPLSEGDRKWLVDRCRKWAGTFDEQLEALEAGEDPGVVREKMDETVRRIVTILRERAQQTRSA
jgi:hypothetical protein